jgi:hypothetical protein
MGEPSYYNEHFPDEKLYRESYGRHQKIATRMLDTHLDKFYVILFMWSIHFLACSVLNGATLQVQSICILCSYWGLRGLANTPARGASGLPLGLACPF